MLPDQRSDMKTTVSTTRKSTEMPLQPWKGRETHKKMRLGCYPINDQTWGRPSALPRKSTEMPLQPWKGTENTYSLELHFRWLDRRSKGLTSILRCLPGGRTAWASLLAALIFSGDQPAVPGQQRCRRHDGGHFLKHAPASFLGLDRQLSALIVVKAPPLVSQWFTSGSGSLPEDSR